MTTRTIILAGAIVASAAAQPPVDAIKSYLNLTDSQIQSLQQTGRQRELARQTAMEQVQQKEKALHDLLEKGGADAATVGKLVLEIETLKKSAGQIDTNFRDQARNGLTADQKAKLKALDDGAALMPAIQQAIGLYLVTPPHPPQGGPGMGPHPGPGPRMQGMPGGPGTPGMRGGGPPPPGPRQ